MMSAGQAAYIEVPNNQQRVMAVQYQMSGATGTQKPVAIYLPPVSQFTYSYTFYVPLDREAYIGVAIDGNLRSHLQYDGTSAAGLFSFNVSQTIYTSNPQVCKPIYP